MGPSGPRRFVLGALAVLATLSAFGASAGASALRVTPIRVEVQAGKQFCSLSIANDGDQPVSVQVRGYRWSKDERGADVLDTAVGFQINPTIVTLKAQESRLIRCSLPPAEGAIEQTWRLVFDELLTPVSVTVPGEIRALLRISVPVFRAPDGASPDISWTLVRTPEGGQSVVLTNSGSRHIRAISLELKPSSGAGQRVERGFYLLAGGRFEIPVALSQASPIAEVLIQTDEGSITPSRAAVSAGAGQ